MTKKKSLKLHFNTLPFQKAYDSSFIVKISLRSHFIRNEYVLCCQKQFWTSYFSRQAKFVRLISEKRLFYSDSEKREFAQRTFERKRCEWNFAISMNSQCAWSIFSGEKLHTGQRWQTFSNVLVDTLPVCSSKNIELFLFPRRTDEIVTKQSGQFGQLSRWPQEGTHFEFGSNEIYRCNVTGSDDLWKCASQNNSRKRVILNFVKFLIHDFIICVALLLRKKWASKA